MGTGLFRTEGHLRPLRNIQTIPEPTDETGTHPVTETGLDRSHRRDTERSEERRQRFGRKTSRTDQEGEAVRARR